MEIRGDTSMCQDIPSVLGMNGYKDLDKSKPESVYNVNIDFGNDKISYREQMREQNSSKSTIHKYSDDVILEETELHLKHDIERENKLPPTSCIGKVRNRGEKFLHSKQILLMVVLLNVLDCVFVLGEMILDIYYIKGVIDQTNSVGLIFIKDMKQHYPHELHYLADDDIQLLLDKVLNANVEWGGTKHLLRNKLKIGTSNNTESAILEKTESDDRRKRQANTLASVDNDKESDDKNNKSKHEMLGGKSKQRTYTIEEKINKLFHKLSITIICILTALTFFKMVCVGKHYFKKFIMAFDGFVVVSSLIIDLVLFEGLHIYLMQEVVIILAFLLPWRVIRVVNSLVVAIKDQDNFRMKLMYKQKKKISQNVSDLMKRERKLELSNNVLKNFLLSRGVTEEEIDRKLAMFKLKQTKGSRLPLLRRNSKDETFAGLETSCTLSILANKINQNVLPISNSLKKFKSYKQMDSSSVSSKGMDFELNFKDNDSPSGFWTSMSSDIWTAL